MCDKLCIAMIELGLQRIQRLLASTHLPWRAIHVAGTNGKGSICFYISGMLDRYNASAIRQSSNLPPIKHGRFTSPHLIDRWDCISVNQQIVSSKLFHEVEGVVLARDAQLGIQASEFETLTATAFEIFTREGVDVAVVEVGMGGRLDATNVLGQPAEDSTDSSDAGPESVTRAAPLVTALAKIGLDHQGFLGNTLEEIAAEKAGIIKSGVPVVYDTSNEPSVLAVFDAIAARHDTKARTLRNLDFPVDRLPPTLIKPRPFGASHDHNTASGDAYIYGVPEHRRNNTSVALCAAYTALQQLDRVPTGFISASEQQWREAGALVVEMIASTASNRVMGRLQMVSLTPLTERTEPVLLDGAHNAQSAAILAEAVEALRKPNDQGYDGVMWVLAASSSKDVRELFAPLLREGDAVVAVEFGPVDGMPWVKAMAGDEILRAALDVTDGCVDSKGNYGRDVVAGLRAAADVAKGGSMVVAGSLYLVGEVMRALREVEMGA